MSCNVSTGESFGWSYRKDESSESSEIIAFSNGSITDRYKGKISTEKIHASGGAFVLRLVDVRLNDSGLYVCSGTTISWQHIVQLSVSGTLKHNGSLTALALGDVAAV